jgi:hypothetical protein
MSKKLIIILFVSLFTSAFSQKSEANFDEEITILNRLGKRILTGQNDSEKYKCNSSFQDNLKQTIDKTGSFDFNFDSLKTISILKAGDLKIYNWVLPLTDGTFKYFAFMQIRKSKDQFSVTQLIDNSDKIKTPETKILTNKNWYGSLYYKIIHNKKLGKNYYTLLGLDWNNNLTNKKIIEVVNISPIGSIKFGAPIFKTKKKTKKRIIFEYSEDAIMSLKYHDNLEKIVFDFLVPTSSKLKGIYEYYGPALNRFDALDLEKGKWIYQEDIKIELDRNIKDFFWKDPKEK